MIINRLLKVLAIGGMLMAGSCAEQEDAEAQVNLGYNYDNGEGVPENDAEAVKWYGKKVDGENIFFEFDCRSKPGLHVANTFPGEMSSGPINDSIARDFKILVRTGVGGSGYPTVFTKFSSDNAPEFRSEFDDAEAILVDDMFHAFDTTGRTLVLVRTYKQDWHGMMTVHQFQTEDKDQLVIFNYPIKCISTYSFKNQ